MIRFLLEAFAGWMIVNAALVALGSLVHLALRRWHRPTPPPRRFYGPVPDVERVTLGAEQTVELTTHSVIVGIVHIFPN